MNRIKCTLSLLLSLILLAGCSKDDDDGPSGGAANDKPYPGSLSGTSWKSHQSDSQGGITIIMETTLVFSSSHSGTYGFYYRQTSVEVEDTFPLSYSYAEGSGNFSYTDDILGLQDFDFNVSNDTLHVHDGVGTYLLKQ